MADLSGYSDSDLVSEMKRRIHGGSVDLLLFDLPTARIHFKGSTDEPRELDDTALLKIAFPFAKLDEDGQAQKIAPSMLRQLPDAQIKSLRDVSMNSIEGVIERIRIRYKLSEIQPEDAEVDSNKTI